MYPRQNVDLDDNDRLHVDHLLDQKNMRSPYSQIKAWFNAFFPQQLPGVQSLIDYPNEFNWQVGPDLMRDHFIDVYRLHPLARVPRHSNVFFESQENTDIIFRITESELEPMQNNELYRRLKSLEGKNSLTQMTLKHFLPITRVDLALHLSKQSSMQNILWPYQVEHNPFSIIEGLGTSAPDLMRTFGLSERYLNQPRRFLTTAGFDTISRDYYPEKILQGYGSDLIMATAAANNIMLTRKGLPMYKTTAGGPILFKVDSPLIEVDFDQDLGF
jgi:hypothetical protein